MKQLILSLGILLLSGNLLSQDFKESNINLSENQPLELRFKYAELIQVSTWQKDEVQLQAYVKVNGKDASEDFKVNQHEENGKMIVTAEIDEAVWPNNDWVRIYDEEEDATVTVTKNGKSFQIGEHTAQRYGGTEVDIVVKVMIPEDRSTKIIAKYGFVELQSVPIQLEVDAKYGGIDASMPTPRVKILRASTSWGQIFTDLEEVRAAGNDMMGKSMQAVLDNEKGTLEVVLDSKYGNIYLRKNE